MLNDEEWDSYLRFLRSIALAQNEAGNGLQDITEAACKAWGANQSEALQAVRNAATKTELPPLPSPTYGISLLNVDVKCCLCAYTLTVLGSEINVKF